MTLYAHKCDNLDEMEWFLERHNLLKPTPGKMDNLNRRVFITDLESIIDSLLKHQVQMDSLVNSTEHLRKKLYQFSTIFSIRQKQKQREYTLTHSMRAALS